MANPEHLAILKQGVEAWNSWRNERTPSDGVVLWAKIPDLVQANLRGAELRGIDLRWARLDGADLRQADLTESHLRETDLRHVMLAEANLTRADLREANLSRVRFGTAILNEAHLAGAMLSACNLSGAHLRSADLSNADLTWTECIAARFTGAKLTAANLKDSDLREADLSYCDLTDVKLDWANLRRVNFSSSSLSGADFSRARLGGTLFGDVDLSAAINLDQAVHGGASVIGVDTLQKSRGNVPRVFLEGAGLSDAAIDYYLSLSRLPVEFYSCFISYSIKDQPFGDRLCADLQRNGVRCWFAPHDAKGGRKLNDQIDEAIRVYDRLLMILSEHSMASEWVKTEIANARQRETREKRQMLFPISLVPFEKIREWKAFDADTGKDSAREIREYFIPDFSNWRDHDGYQAAFQRLLRDLKA